MDADANSITAIVDDSDERWGDPVANVEDRVPFGVKQVDDGLITVPIQSGAILGIQGQPGARKTTLLLNLMLAQFLSGRLPPGMHVCIDTLEAGITVERYSDMMLAILATKILLHWHWHQTENHDVRKLFAHPLPVNMPPQRLVEDCGVEINGHFVRETVLRPDFFRFGQPTPRQEAAIKLARAIMRTWPLLIYGQSEHPNAEIAKARSFPTTDLEASYKRWLWLTDKLNMRELAVDHLQEYQFRDGPNDYELMKRVVNAGKAWQSHEGCRGVFWVISQEGITAAREARATGRDPHAQGGKVLEAEANYQGRVRYDQNNPYWFDWMRPNKSRIGHHPTLSMAIEPNSGAFLYPFGHELR